MFSPCNIPLERLIAEHKEEMERGHERRRAAMQRSALKPHVADSIRRRETAVLLCLERLLAVEQGSAQVTQ